MNRPARSNPRRARLVWVAGAVAAAAVVAAALMAAGVDELEILATVLFVVVFAAALLGGRTTGFLAAAACATVYLVLRSQDVEEVGAPAVGLLVLTRAACYVAVVQVTEMVRARLPAVDLPARLPTSWDADDAPVATALYAGPSGSLSAERTAPPAPAAWADDRVDDEGWGERRDDDYDFAAAAAAAAADGWAPAGTLEGAAGPGHDDPWAAPAPEPMLAPASMGQPAPAGWDQPPETLDPGWPAQGDGYDDGYEDGYDEWGEPLPAAAGVDAAGPGGWEQPTGVMPQVPEAPIAAVDPIDPIGQEPPGAAPWEVNVDTAAVAMWTPSAYDRPPAPSMPTGWIDDATSPLGDETIPVGYTGELFIAREVARLPSEAPPAPAAGSNGAPVRVNGGPDHHDVDRRAANGHHAGPGAPPPASVPPASTSPPPPPRPRQAPAYVPMSDPSEGIDPETRLWNARFFRERLATARDAALRSGSGFSVVMIQVPDHPFQSLPYRRQVALLRELGHQFVSARMIDHLVHLPDENLHWFAVVLSDSDRVGATAFERRLRSAISGYLRNRGLAIGEIKSLSLTSPDDDEAMEMVWSSLLGPSGGPSGGPEGPAMAYDGRI